MVMLLRCLVVMSLFINITAFSFSMFLCPFVGAGIAGKLLYPKISGLALYNSFRVMIAGLLALRTVSFCHQLSVLVNPRTFQKATL